MLLLQANFLPIFYMLMNCQLQGVKQFHSFIGFSCHLDWLTTQTPSLIAGGNFLHWQYGPKAKPEPNNCLIAFDTQ